jgi:predicted phage terminase large subunit-like protein
MLAKPPANVGLYKALENAEKPPDQVEPVHTPEELDEAKALAIKMLAAQSSLVEFRSRFLPLPREVPPAWFHHHWSDILLNGKKNFVAEGFRESGKTSLVIKGAPLHALTFPTEERRYIVFLLTNATLAQKRLSEIVLAYESNPDLSSNLVRVTAYTPSLGIYEVVVTDGEKDIPIRIEAYGKGMSIRGLSWNDRRPDLIIIDDPQDLDDVTSDLVVDRDWDWFLSEVKFLGKDARIFLIGNNLGEKCIVERCMENKEILDFDGIRVPVADPTFTKAAWEERFPLDFVIHERDTFESIGKSDIWWRERMCKSTSPESQRFRRSLFKYYIPSEMAGKIRGMTKFTTTDLAIGETKRSDYTVVLTIAVDENDNWYILDIEYGRWNPTQTMDAIFRAVIKYNPRLVGVESVAYQAALTHFLEREMSTRKRFFSIYQLKSEGRKKELRIESIHPRFVAGQIFFPVGADFLPELENELLSFPRGGHDDLIDALSYQDQIAAAPAQWSSSGGDEYEIPIAGGM